MQVTDTTPSVAPLFSIFKPTHKFTPLFEYFHSIILKLINANVLKLTPMK